MATEIVIISFAAEKVLSFSVPGKPVPFHRPGHTGARQSYFNPARYKDYVAKVRTYLRMNAPYSYKAGTPRRPPPDKKGRYAVLIELDTTRNPDVDNLVKPFLDGLAGVVYNDDRQVDKVWIERWAVGKETVRHKAKVTVYRMPSAATKRKR